MVKVMEISHVLLSSHDGWEKKAENCLSKPKVESGQDGFSAIISVARSFKSARFLLLSIDFDTVHSGQGFELSHSLSKATLPFCHMVAC